MPAGSDTRPADRFPEQPAGRFADRFAVGPRRPYPERVGSHMFMTPRGRLRSKAWRIYSAH
ncbi:hypothetical protein SBD_2726 [Streptomyces bottropensis ATCC 25435]|uniref:Uncharacterized protein n=1 Tax=Streptomyces bottropensis ATCC 25435 TaxID=1054862 RepID=M3F1M2_9ACTN|nr:hypothetical protein SBD_2726 [Streptomyces bottropensis ATCC 25435]